MALLNRPMTTDEVRELMDSSPSAMLYSGVMMELMTSTRYQTVRYRGAINRTDYERRDTFYALGPGSPSDSVWMIPCGIGAMTND